jgi:hypothetical protein
MENAEEERQNGKGGNAIQNRDVEMLNRKMDKNC